MAHKHVDQIIFEAGVLRVDGWSESGPPTIVSLDGQDHPVKETAVVRRPDVAARLGAKAVGWGFSARFSLGDVTPDLSGLLIHFADGEAVRGEDASRIRLHVATRRAYSLRGHVSKRPLAVVTMARNEPDYLPIWLRHYGLQVGPDDCYVLDHASDDGSTNDLPCNVIRLPSSPYDIAAVSEVVSSFCASLLRNYSAVIYTDADEIIIADPLIANSLTEYVLKTDPPRHRNYDRHGPAS